MVFFTCNACGQAVKKNQVEKHYTTKCRNCTVLSCIDCGKEFCGDEYQSHVKCISENEKYGGKDFQPKPSAAKGETKQANWIANIKNYIANTSLPQKLSSLLNDLVRYDNIPRKKKAFQNFLINSVRIRDKGLSEEAWEVFMKANQQSEVPSNTTENNNESAVASKPNKVELNKENLINTSVTLTEKVIHKNKKKKKDEEMQVTKVHTENHEASKKQKKHSKDEVEEQLSTNNLAEENVNNDNERKKSKKNKRHSLEEFSKDQMDIVPGETTEVTTNGKIKKHKKKKKAEAEMEESEQICDAEGENPSMTKEDSSENDHIKRNSIENTGSDVNAMQKKKKHKKRKKVSMSEDLEHGSEVVQSEKLDSKHKNTKHKAAEDHSANTGEIESTLPTNYEMEENHFPKKKKKKK